jgi:CTP synthase
MPDQRDMEEKGARCAGGSHRALTGTKVAHAYGSELIYERHRHCLRSATGYREAPRMPDALFVVADGGP